MPFIPHTENEITKMLEACHVQSLQALFDEVPIELRSSALDNIPEGMNEWMVTRHMQTRMSQMKNSACFVGAGAYEHHIPAVVWDITTRGEFLTAYTPYQAEASQGTLQLLYEFQTMISRLMGMECANASLYDGATALAEAVLMAIRLNRKVKDKKIAVPESLHPFYLQTLKTIVAAQGVELLTVSFDVNQLPTEKLTAVVIPQPNFFGQLEAVDALTDWAHAQDALVIACVNPIAMALLKEPGQWGKNGADIVCGEGQPLGVPLASGGPYFGFLCTRLHFVRQMPGRIIGRTTDANGHSGFTLTLQAREQHIRRAKATSNICTNQGLLVTAATIYMSLLGFDGIQAVAKTSHLNTKKCYEKLLQIPGVEAVFENPFFHECVIRLSKPVEKVTSELMARGIFGGYHLGEHYPHLENCYLVCVTETKTDEDIDQYHQALSFIMK